MRADTRYLASALVLLLAGAAGAAGAQGAGNKWFDGRYEVECDLVGTQGSQVLTVWGFGKTEEAAAPIGELKKLLGLS